MSNEKISHKELLTFSNLTSLEWEFVPLEAIKEGEEPVGGEETSSDELSTQLNDLLNPELFISGYRDPEEEENPIYVYSEADEDGNYKRKEGLREIREAAGIAMEYKEKDTEEANFLKDWEVIYGAEKKQFIVKLQNK